MPSAFDEFYADTEELLNHSDYCRRELRAAGDLKEFLGRALGSAPPELYLATRSLMNDAEDLETYFTEMEKALQGSSEVVQDFVYHSTSKMEDAEDELAHLLRAQVRPMSAHSIG